MGGNVIYQSLFQNVYHILLVSSRRVRYETRGSHRPLLIRFVSLNILPLFLLCFGLVLSIWLFQVLSTTLSEQRFLFILIHLEILFCFVFSLCLMIIHILENLSLLPVDVYLSTTKCRDIVRPFWSNTQVCLREV